MWQYVYYQRDWGFPPTILHVIYYVLPNQEDFFSVFTSLSSWQPAPQLEFLHVVVIKIIKIPDKTTH